MPIMKELNALLCAEEMNKDIESLPSKMALRLDAILPEIIKCVNAFLCKNYCTHIKNKDQ